MLTTRDPDDLEIDGPEPAGWCEPILKHWADYLVVVHTLTGDGAVFTSCDACSELYLLQREAVGSSCLMPPCEGTRSHSPQIRFVNPGRWTGGA